VTDAFKGPCALKTVTTWKLASCFILAGLFCFAGVMHFRKSGLFLRAMPPWLPFHLPAVLISGFFEILGAVGLVVPKTRRAAALGLIALLAAVFPANIYMAQESAKFAPVPGWALWLRLPFQFVFMAWINWSTKPTKSTGSSKFGWLKGVSGSQCDLESGDDRGQ
jgi:uncharacterized membrane protein